jgi:hypothetical protein
LQVKLNSTKRMAWANIKPKKARPLTTSEKIQKFFRSLFSKKLKRKTLVSFPTIKRVYANPQLIAQDLVAVQPMAQPQGFFHGHLIVTLAESVGNPIVRAEKIIGNSIEEYFVNLIEAWNKLDENIISHDRKHIKIVNEYCYKMKKLVEQYPEIINYYNYTFYDLNIIDIKGEKRKHKFVGYKVMPKTIAAGNDMVCLWYTIKHDNKTETYILDRPDYKKEIITDLKSMVKRMLMELEP